MTFVDDVDSKIARRLSPRFTRMAWSLTAGTRRDRSVAVASVTILVQQLPIRSLATPSRVQRPQVDVLIMAYFITASRKPLFYRHIRTPPPNPHGAEEPGVDYLKALPQLNAPQKKGKLNLDIRNKLSYIRYHCVGNGSWVELLSLSSSIGQFTRPCRNIPSFVDVPDTNRHGQPAG